MLLREIGERAVVELDSLDCEMLARACRLAAGSQDSLSYNAENAACFFAAASAISRMHGWHNQPHDTPEKLDALCKRVEQGE